MENKFKLSLIAAASTVMLSGCFLNADEPNPITPPPTPPPAPTPTELAFQGEGLKGLVLNASVVVRDYDGTEVATTSTDATTGQFVIELIDADGQAFGGEYVASIYADDDTTMICDAVTCSAADATTPVDFGDAFAVPADPDNALLETIVEIECDDDGSCKTEAVAQLNVLSSIATQVYKSQLEAIKEAGGSLTAEQKAQAKKQATKVVLQVLGVDTSDGSADDLDIFAEKLPNLNDIDSVTAANDAAADADLAKAKKARLLNAAAALNAAVSGLGTEGNVGQQVSSLVKEITKVAKVIVNTKDVTKVQEALTAAGVDSAAVTATLTKVATKVNDLGARVDVTKNDVVAKDVVEAAKDAVKDVVKDECSGFISGVNNDSFPSYCTGSGTSN